MKPVYPIAAVFGLICVALMQSIGQAPTNAAKHEYVTIRWGGKENTHLIRPGGKVEFIGTELRRLPRPDHVDERSFYLNAAINGLAAEGFEVAGMTSDEVVMTRPSMR